MRRKNTPTRIPAYTDIQIFEYTPMELNHETISALIQSTTLLNPSYRISVHEHTPEELIKEASKTYITDWFKQAYILLNGGYLSIEDINTKERYKVTLQNLNNGLDILKANHKQAYDALDNKHYWTDYANMLIQCTIHGTCT